MAKKYCLIYNIILILLYYVQDHDQIRPRQNNYMLNTCIHHIGWYLKL